MKGSRQGSRLGRPRLPSDVARSERIVTFVTPGEFESIAELSDRLSLSLSATVYRLLSEALERSKRDPNTTPRRIT